MNPFVRDILAILDAHPLVSSIKIVHLDETPSGGLEVKIRCRIGCAAGAAGEQGGAH
jgi:hypothetical protein